MSEDPLVEQLKSKDVKKRRQAAYYLEQQTIFDWVADRDERDISHAIPALAEALNDEDQEVRKNALSAIMAAQGDRQDVDDAIPAMVDILKDTGRTELKNGAAHFLKNCAKEGADIKQFIDVLQSLLLDEGDDDVILGSADALAMYYIKKKQWANFQEMLSHTNKEVRQEAVGAIGRAYLSSLPLSVMKDIISLLDDENIEVQIVSIRTLAEIKLSIDQMDKLVSKMLEFVEHPTDKYRNTVLSSIRNLIRQVITCIGDYPDEFLEVIQPVVNHVNGLLGSKNKDYKGFAAETMVMYHSHRKEWDSVIRLIHHKTKTISKKAFGNLGNCGLVSCKLDLTPILNDIISFLPGDKEIQSKISYFIRWHHVNHNAFITVVQSNGENIDAAWALIMEAREEANKKTTSNLRKKLDTCNQEEKLSFLVEVARKHPGEPRRWAIERIAELSTFYKQSITASVEDIVRYTKDEDPFVRKEAVYALGFFSKQKKFTSLVPSIITLLSDKYEHVRNSAAKALSWASDNEGDVSSAFKALSRILLEENNKDTRAHAAIAFFHSAKAGHDVSAYHNLLVKTMNEDPDETTRKFCLWTMERYSITKENAPCVVELLDKLKRQGKETKQLATHIKKLLGTSHVENSSKP